MSIKFVMGYPVEEPDPEPNIIQHIKKFQPDIGHVFTPPNTRFKIHSAVGRRKPAIVRRPWQ